jgi:hypothetical protein
MSKRKITKQLRVPGVVFILYLAVSLFYFGTTRNYSHRYLRWGAERIAYIWFLNWWPWAIAHGLNPFVSYYIWYPQGFNMTWAGSVPAATSRRRLRDCASVSTWACDRDPGDQLPFRRHYVGIFLGFSKRYQRVFPCT